MDENGATTQELNDTFKSELSESMDKNIPSKEIRSKKKTTLDNTQNKEDVQKETKAIQTSQTNNYKHFQKEIKKQIRKAEWTYKNDIILKGLKFNNTKPFWKYIKSRKNDNIGVSSLKNIGKLVSDSKGKAEILIQQFKSIFTIDKSTAIPQTTKHIDEPIPKLTIRENGVEKLLQDINPSKASGPDGIPNCILKECASQIAPSLTVFFPEIDRHWNTTRGLAQRKHIMCVQKKRYTCRGKL